ncbi:universal stress protein [Ureibacillus xyleni]|uniref:universal stress protein n=1 Tax=Ureibacillus xyleni TaxID=614648 RepID=UPI000BE2292D|nr:universal stress protein [Ureibacillus xyleni]
MSYRSTRLTLKALVLTIPIKTLHQFGAPKFVITGEVAKAVNADFILCGATGKHGVERLLVESISDQSQKPLYVRRNVMF